MPDLLRLTDRATVRALRILFKAGSGGVPRIWVSRWDLVELGYAEWYTDPLRSYPLRVKLSDLGVTIVETLINLKE